MVLFARPIALGWLSAALVFMVSLSLVNATPLGQESLSDPSVTLDQTTDPTDWVVQLITGEKEDQQTTFTITGADGGSVTQGATVPPLPLAFQDTVTCNCTAPAKLAISNPNVS